MHQVSTAGLTVVSRLLKRVALVDDEFVARRVESRQIGVGRRARVGAPIHRELCNKHTHTHQVRLAAIAVRGLLDLVAQRSSEPFSFSTFFVVRCGINILLAYDFHSCELECVYCIDVYYNLPSVAKTSTSQRLRLPSTPTSWRKTYWPTRARAHWNVFVTPSSVQKIIVLVICIMEKPL